MNPIVEIDVNSGFCFGVVTAIKKAEEELERSGHLYCLGDIVHNNDEVERLKEKGLVTISHRDLEKLSGVKVLLRAHGEPPSTYALAKKNNIEIIDATCPVVLQLQQRIKKRYAEGKESGNSQIVIFGKKGHAEVNGLVGQTDGEAIVIENINELDKINLTRDIDLYSQTTKSLPEFKAIIHDIERKKKNGCRFNSYDTICRQVANRVENLRQFASSHDLILFVSDEKSSNGKFLFSECKSVNPSAVLVRNEKELLNEWFAGKKRIGICGATSTPRWLMEKVKEKVMDIIK